MIDSPIIRILKFDNLNIFLNAEIFRLMPTFCQPVLAGFVRAKRLAANKTRKIIKNIDNEKYSKSKISSIFHF